MTELTAPLVLTIRQAKELAPAIGTERIRQAAARREFYAKLDGNRWLIDRDSFIAWLRKQTGASVH